MNKLFNQTAAGVVFAAGVAMVVGPAFAGTLSPERAASTVQAQNFSAPLNVAAPVEFAQSNNQGQGSGVLGNANKLLKQEKKNKKKSQEPEPQAQEAETQVQEPEPQAQEAEATPQPEVATEPKPKKKEKKKAKQKLFNEAPAVKKADKKKKKKKKQAAEQPQAVETQPATAGNKKPFVPQPENSSGPSAEQLEAEAAKQAEEEIQEPVKVSDEAAKPTITKTEPVAEQIEKAQDKAITIVPDNVTAEDVKRLRAAEKKRRKKRRQERNRLIGAIATGITIGAIIPQLGGRVAADEGDLFVVERDGEYFVRRDDSELIRDGSRVEYEQARRGRVREIITRPNGTQIITLRDAGGYILRRVKVYPNGERVVLFDIRDQGGVDFVDYDRQLPPLRVRRPLDSYIVSARRADRRLFYDTFTAEPVENVEQGYSLQAVRDNERLRAIVPRIDLDTITFATGSAYVSQSQIRYLGDIAGAIFDVIDENPGAVFMIEGHTDAVGSELSNLVLSDRRADSVARILVEAYGIPPENLVMQGYGERYLKVPTEGPSQANRRATIRNITPILYSQNQ